MSKLAVGLEEDNYNNDSDNGTVPLRPPRLEAVDERQRAAAVLLEGPVVVVGLLGK